MWHGDINVLIIKGKYDAQCDVCYCTSWSGPNKLGRPSKKDGKRKHRVMDHIEKVGMKKKEKEESVLFYLPKIQKKPPKTATKTISIRDY